MKIVHLVQHYMPGYTYQENYLPAAMAKLGHEVLIVSGVDNPEFYTDVRRAPGETIEDKGVRVVYLKVIYRRLHTPIDGLYELLTKEKPDLIFVHGFLLARSFDLLKYERRHKECAMCADTHETYLLAFNACFSGSLKDRVRRFVYFRLAYRLWRRHMERRYAKVFYVTPPRKTYAVRELGFSEQILFPLWLGAEIESLPYEQKPVLRKKIRAAQGLPADAKILILAGKLDEKKRPAELAEAFLRLNRPGWWLIFAGSMDENIRSHLEMECRDNERIRCTGFLPGDVALEYIAASDLAVYPGAHSVFWEQTVCLGIPALFHEPEPGDAAHLSDPDHPGALFLQTGSADELYDLLSLLIDDGSRLARMGENARRYGEERLSYTQLAKTALEAVENSRMRKR